MAEHKLQFIIDAENRSKAAFDQVKGQMDNVQGKIENMKPAFQKMALVGAAAFTAISAAVYKSIQAYQEEERANARLTHLLKQTSNATDAQVASLMRQATALQAVGVVGDETIKFGQSQLATFALQADTIGVLTPALLDLVVANKGVNATQEDMITMGNLVGKVMTGQTGALSRYGVTLSDAQAEQLKLGNEMERATILAEILSQNFGGLNEAMRETSEGGIVALKNSFGDMQELLGEQFIPILESVVQKVVPVVDKIAEWIAANPELTRNIVIAAAAISGLVAVVGMLGLVLPAIITGFTLLLSPVGLLIIAIGVLTVAGVLLVQRWGEIKTQFIAIWDLIKFSFKQAGDIIKEVLYQIERAFENAYNFIKSKTIDPLIDTVNALVNSLTRVWEAAQRVGGAVSGAVGKVFGAGQFGIESVPRTGMYMLHRGETVNTAGGGGSIVVNINGGYYLSETVAEEIGDMIIDKLKNTFKL